jgi:hypothetical protein
MTNENRKGPRRESSPESNSGSTGFDGNRAERAKTEPLNSSGSQGEFRQQKEERSAEAVPAANPRPISERKLRANRANAKKSTGPRTARGKSFSRLNALKHGLCSGAVLFRPDGTPIDPELQAVWARLQEEYGKGDAATDELVQAVVAECSHQRRATELEPSCFQRDLEDSRDTVSLDKLQRHQTRSRRALMKNLARLRKPAPTTSPTEEDEPERN